MGMGGAIRNPSNRAIRPIKPSLAVSVNLEISRGLQSQNAKTLRIVVITHGAKRPGYWLRCKAPGHFNILNHTTFSPNEENTSSVAELELLLLV